MNNSSVSSEQFRHGAYERMRKVFEKQLEERTTRVMAPVKERRRSSKKATGDKILVVDRYEEPQITSHQPKYTKEDEEKFLKNVPSLMAAQSILSKTSKTSSLSGNQ